MRTKLFIIITIILAIMVITSMIFFSLSTHQKPPLKPSLSPTPTLTKTLTITPYQQLPLSEQIKLQSEADENYTKIQDSILAKYPWYNELPLQKENYIIYFDPPQEKFIARLYPQQKSAVSIETQVDIMKKEIKLKLESLRVDNKIGIDWQVKPEL